MITSLQANDLSAQLHIDAVTICREYLQLVILNALFQTKMADKICFKGGTALRLVFGSPRYSEDLDFDTILDKKGLKGLMANLEKVLSREIPNLKITALYSGIHGMRFRVAVKIGFLKFPLTVRLDFTIVNKIKSEISSLQTNFPVAMAALINHSSPENIFKEKLLAVVGRKKGRDIYDLWFLVHKMPAFDKALATKNVLKEISGFPQNKLELDLRRFLPREQKKITPFLKDQLLAKLAI